MNRLVVATESPLFKAVIEDVVKNESNDDNAEEIILNEEGLREVLRKEPDVFYGELFIPEVDLNPRQGPGQLGRPYHVPEHDNAREKREFSINQFNIVASDAIGVNRSLPDIRHRKCNERPYPRDLPDTSIVIVFHNEAWSTLLRTIHSVINRSPWTLLREIVLVDDASDKDFLGAKLETYIASLSVKFQVIRLKKRSGLIVARLAGAEATSGDVITFLDSHCECTRGWLEPLLAEVAKNRTSVAIPVIDVIDANTFAYSGNSEVAFAGGFNWRLEFRWNDMTQREIDRLNGDKSLPFETPTMAGGLFSIDREYFYESGSYDKGMEIWGAENLEMSFRIWQCGGRLLIVPCSHVGHIFRKLSPYSWPGGTGATLNRNTRRMVEVWLDEYKYFWYQMHIGWLDEHKYFWYQTLGALNHPYGDITARVQFRKSKKCKSFRWFLQNIWPESPMNIDLDFFGSIQNEQFETQCLDTLGDQTGKKIGMIRCHKQGGNQFFAMTLAEEIRNNENCIDAAQRNGPVTMYKCHGQKGNQQFIYRNETAHIFHVSTNQCLDVNKKMEPFITDCNNILKSQKWKVVRLGGLMKKMQNYKQINRL